MNVPKEILIFIAGLLVSGVGSYLVFGREVSYIKGQLTQVMTFLGSYTRKAEQNAKILGEVHRDHAVLKKDLNNFYCRLKVLEENLPPKTIS